jgi:hypothetical protein
VHVPVRAEHRPEPGSTEARHENADTKGRAERRAGDQQSGAHDGEDDDEPNRGAGDERGGQGGLRLRDGHEFHLTGRDATEGKAGSC